MERMDKLRRRLKAVDDFDLPMKEDFLDQLHDKIMAKVEESEMAPPPALMKQRNFFRNHWRAWLYATSSVGSMVFVAGVLSSQFFRINQSLMRVGLFSDGRERIISEALQAPEFLSQTLISPQSEADFFVDVATESFENLSVAKFNQLMGEKRTH